MLASALMCAALPAWGVPLRWPEGTLRGFPVVRDASGQQIADGTLTQWIEDGNLANAPVRERHFDLGAPLGNAEGVHGYLIGPAGCGSSAVNSLHSCG